MVMSSAFWTVDINSVSSILPSPASLLWNPPLGARRAGGVGSGGRKPRTSPSAATAAGARGGWKGTAAGGSRVGAAAGPAASCPRQDSPAGLAPCHLAVALAHDHPALRRGGERSACGCSLPPPRLRSSACPRAARCASYPVGVLWPEAPSWGASRSRE